MTRRRAKFRRFQGKMVKLKPGELLEAATNHLKMSLLIIVIIATISCHCGLPALASETSTGSSGGHLTPVSARFSDSHAPSTRHSRRLGGGTGSNEADPMEPCYLANNRASETLTISESTPVGTVVGEIMVIGDLENIELSIRMPGGHSNAADDFVMVSAASNRQQQQQLQKLQQATSGTQQSQSQVAAAGNGYYSAAQNNIELAKRSGPLRNFSSSSPSSSSLLGQDQSRLDNNHDRPNDGQAKRGAPSLSPPATGPKSARDLSEKIDLMPPLSLEQNSKKLILAKKLDRENLDKYVQLTGNSPSLSQSSSASLTVHIKCQLKARQASSESSGLADQQQQQSQLINDHKMMANRTQGDPSRLTSHTSKAMATSQATSQKLVKDSKASSILIPVHLIITDENDNWPSFTGGPYIIDLNESAQVGSLLQNNEILAFDNDQPGPLSTIEYSIVPGSFWSDSFGFLNPLDARSLIVKDNRWLDYESQSKITLKVMARDQGDPPNWAITSLYVNLLDQDDLNPVFNEDKYTAIVRENRPGEKIDLMPRRMVAYDGDKILAAPVTYSFYMKTNHSIHFDLDPDLGQLTLKKILPNQDQSGADFGLPNQPFCLLIKASQLDNPRRWTLTSVSVRLMTSGGATEAQPTLGAAFRSSSDGEDQFLSFAQSNYTLEVSEAALVGSTIFTARTNHRYGVNYQLLDNDSGYFQLDPNSGRLTLNRSLDYEMFRHLSVRILATAELLNTLEDYNRTMGPLRGPNSNSYSQPASSSSTNYPRLACDITRVNINVLNHNDYAPEFSHEQYNFQLSISDLIANFEPDSSKLTMDLDPNGDLSELTGRNTGKLAHRFGELELSDDESLEDLDYKAIQLGQVYCADRDFNDRVQLQLSGSRASLFHLTQDGRLYLPLINASSLMESRNQASQLRPNDPTKWGSKSHRTINNQLVMNRLLFASARRSDEQQRRNQPDRAYLNYLLSELSNLGRLRLKVLASDGGQPETKQSTALIVISIISIDNFIIQRAPHTAPSNQADQGELIQLTNDTSYQTTMARSGVGETGPSLAPDTRGYISQMMMIPSMNGKSFVQINPDIIGNLLAASSGINVSSSSKATDSTDRFRSQLPDVLESSASNTVSNSINFREATGHHYPSFGNKPPGLLLVDDDGAKFVAMPTAMEVYNQQVQEAAGQQARQKSKQALDQSESGSSGDKKSSSWFSLGDNLSLHSDNKLMRWINLSTAIALHLIVIVCIISLATRIRHLVGAGGSGGSSDGPNLSPNQETSSNIHSDNNRWPKRITNLGSFFVDKQGDAVSNMLSQHHLASSFDATAASGDGLHTITDPYQYQHQHTAGRITANTISPNETRQASECRQQSIVSSGIVVSARSMGQLEEQSPASPTSARAELNPEARNQQNLFEHLKLTLNKMLDNNNNKEDMTTSSSDHTGHMSIRPLDSDVVQYEDQRDRQLDMRAQLNEARTTTSSGELKLLQQTKMSPAGKSPISTFVGVNNNNNRSPTIQQECSTSVSQNRARPAKQPPTVVSINVVAPKQDRDQREKSKTTNNNNINSSSSNSSVVSLVSMSSSLSNKITEAVGLAASQRTNESDSTSLNSSILLNGCAGSSSSSNSSNSKPAASGHQRTASSKLPPAPPPLPPPPSLVRATVQDSQRNLYTTTSQTKRYTSGPASPRVMKSGPSSSGASSATRRQTPPENPVHLRLRRDAVADQLAAINHSNHNAPSRDYQPGEDWRPTSAETNKQNRTSRSNSAVGGRREARNQQTSHNNQTSSPPISTKAYQQQHSRNSNFEEKATPPSSNKTVSPTTSVDRGYESFQSFGFQPSGRQFASLQECPQSCNNADCEQMAASLPEGNLGRRANRVAASEMGSQLHRSSQVARGSRKQLLGATANVCSSSASSSPRSPSQDKLQMIRGSEMREFVVGSRPDCDTEDDDFFYYCGESVHANEHQVGCLSYSNHTYHNQQQQQQQQQVMVQPGAYQPEFASKSLAGCSNRRFHDRRTTTTTGGKHSSDLIYQGEQPHRTTSQLCDMMPRGRRQQQPQGPGRLRHISGPSSSQLTGEIGVKKLTWSDQVN